MENGANIMVKDNVGIVICCYSFSFSFLFVYLFFELKKKKNNINKAWCNTPS